MPVAGVDRFHRTLVLDRLRGFAVLSVIVYHVVPMSPVPLPGLGRVTWYGQYGVDLFFVLSGWLIGGLYWREVRAFGGITVTRFWVRRWIRTLPPYFVALLLSWLAVFVMRSESFDWRYIVFLQNYYERIPFFLVSWSLCVEEHFYVVAPIILAALMFAIPRHVLWLPWVCLIALSPYFRWVEWLPDSIVGFGYNETATHLRLDGIVLGFGLSYLDVITPIRFNRLAKWSVYVIPACFTGLIILEWAGGVIRSVLWNFVISLLCASSIIVGVLRERTADRQRLIRRFSPWTTIAITSYSAYLVHPLAIHLARTVVSVLSPALLFLYWPTVIGFIALSTFVFFVCVERPSIALRNTWVPSRLSS